MNRKLDTARFIARMLARFALFTSIIYGWLVAPSPMALITASWIILNLAKEK